jgi:hypothetical protein
MAEPPRPKTPAEKAKESAQMSGSIEKPGIDGRNSAADRVVEANLYGNHLVAGEVPIMVSFLCFRVFCRLITILEVWTNDLKLIAIKAQKLE